MDEIKRMGPPEVLDVVGSEYRLAVPLNRVPPPAWWTFFRDPGEWSTQCHPRAVGLQGNALVFDSTEEEVRAWVSYVDRWIVAANGSFAVEWKRRRAEQEMAAEARRRRLEEARGKFRNL